MSYQSWGYIFKEESMDPVNIEPEKGLRKVIVQIQKHWDEKVW